MNIPASWFTEGVEGRVAGRLACPFRPVSAHFRIFFRVRSGWSPAPGAGPWPTSRPVQGLNKGQKLAQMLFLSDLFKFLKTIIKITPNQIKHSLQLCKLAPGTFVNFLAAEFAARMALATVSMWLVVSSSSNFSRFQTQIIKSLFIQEKQGEYPRNISCYEFNGIKKSVL